jgi:hypothetical protein
MEGCEIESRQGVGWMLEKAMKSHYVLGEKIDTYIHTNLFL